MIISLNIFLAPFVLSSRGTSIMVIFVYLMGIPQASEVLVDFCILFSFYSSD